jgi:hypothetical protein
MNNKVIFIFLFSFTSFNINASDLGEKVIFKKADYIANKDSLSGLYSNHKTFIPKLELQALVALYYFPELKNVRIKFKRKKLNTTMASRPSFSSIFKSRSKRLYEIYLNDFPDVDIPFDSTSFNAQVGIIGHELAHIVDYEARSKIELIKLAFKYRDKKFRAKMEADTDIRTIYRGLGWQVLAFEKFVNNYPHTPKEYKKYKEEIYLSPQDILGHIREYIKSLKVRI